MFSDFKTRGFGITQSQIKRPDRLARLILVLAIAMYWAVSTGATEEHLVAKRGEKRGAKSPTIPMFTLQIGHSCHSKSSCWIRKNPQTLGGLDKLKGGEDLLQNMIDAWQ